jgi:hypothetical protein
MPRTYTMTAGSIVGKARTLLNDTRTDTGYRSPDTDLFAALNDAIAAAVAHNPGLFEIDAVHTCDAGYLQTVAVDRSTALIEVVGLPECDEATLTQFRPQWTNATPGAASNWMRPKGEPLKFMTYPPAVGGEQYRLRLVRSLPPVTALSDVIALPESLEPLFVEYVVGRIETSDDEHSSSGRAAALLDRFVAGMKASALG